MGPWPTFGRLVVGAVVVAALSGCSPAIIAASGLSRLQDGRMVLVVQTCAGDNEVAVDRVTLRVDAGERLETWDLDEPILGSGTVSLADGFESDLDTETEYVVFAKSDSGFFLIPDGDGGATRFDLAAVEALERGEVLAGLDSWESPEVFESVEDFQGAVSEYCP